MTLSPGQERSPGCMGLLEGTAFGAGCNELVVPVLREAYANCTVLEARPCYDVARLMFLDAER